MPDLTIPAPLMSKLWKHQREGCEFAITTLRPPSRERVCLLRMPTGTGKTGVIATLAMAMPPVGWTLVITPWTNLATQVTEDLSERFWARIGWKPDRFIPVARIFPKNVGKEILPPGANRVLVSTFATLLMIRKRQPVTYKALASRLGQVIVDEGHYEPAVQWGQAVKQLKQPTLLLTATPYRNDLKLFRVKGHQAYHYTHKEAEFDHIIREIEFMPLPVDEPVGSSLDKWCLTFSKRWKSLREQAQPVKKPRGIICCSRMATVRRVTELLRHQGINAIGIHERFAQAKRSWLHKRTPEPREESSEIWVHQNKLTEGLDDNRFCVLAVCNRIRNDRKLVQQIGRVLRTAHPKQQERAIVLFSRDLPVERSWQNYRNFETHKELADPERYRAIFMELLLKQPTMEYFGGGFRQRFDPNSRDLPEQVRLRAAAIVRKVEKGFSFEEFAEYTTDFLLLEDRILLGPTQDCFAPSKNTRLSVYALIANSPLLADHSLYEIRLGACAATIHGDLLFMVDTEGTYPADFLEEHAHKVSPDMLSRLFGKHIVPKEVSLANPWPAGPSVRRATLLADDLASTPAQLTDAGLVCSSVRATLLSKGRKDARRRQYVGFQRGKIAEDLRSNERSEFRLAGFVEWTKGVSENLTDRHRGTPDFFRRFLTTVEPPQPPRPSFLVVNLFDSDLEIQDSAGASLELVDSIIEVTTLIDSQGEIEFSCSLRFAETLKVESDLEPRSSTKSLYNATLRYDEENARFSIRGETLNSEIMVYDRTKDELEGICTFLNRREEEFAIALEGGDIFYTAQTFYRLDYSGAEQRLGSMLTAFEELRSTTSEKGKKKELARATNWLAKSVFGFITNLSQSGLLQTEFGEFDWLFCDDLQTEVADFVCADFKRRKIALIHAKSAEDRIVSASALHDVVAQGLKNLGYFSRNAKEPPYIERWNRQAVWKKGIGRWRKGPNDLPENQRMWAKIKRDILEHPDGIKEVWLVVGATLNRTQFLKSLGDEAKRTAEAGQVFHLLSSLSASAVVTL